MNGVMKRVEENGNEIFRGREKRRLTFLFCADDLVLCCDSEEIMRIIIRCSVEVCQSKGLRVTAAKS